MPRSPAWTPSLVAALRSWQREKKGELRYAVVRHAERADTAGWALVEGCKRNGCFKKYPFAEFDNI